MLELKQTGQLIDVNPRIEFHGEEQKLAADIKVSMTVGNQLLAEWHPLLRSCFFRKADAAQDAFELGDDHKPSLVFPKLGPLKWEETYEPCDVSISSAVGVPVNISMTKVGKTRFELMEGGSVIVTMTIQCNPSPSQVSRLCEMLALSEVEISIIQQKAEASAEKAAA